MYFLRTVPSIDLLNNDPLMTYPIYVDVVFFISDLHYNIFNIHLLFRLIDNTIKISHNKPNHQARKHRQPLSFLIKLLPDLIRSNIAKRKQPESTAIHRAKNN